MLKAGVQLEAVRMKMTQDGISSEIVSKFPNTAEVCDEKCPAHVVKYQVMNCFIVSLEILYSSCYIYFVENVEVQSI